MLEARKSVILPPQLHFSQKGQTQEDEEIPDHAIFLDSVSVGPAGTLTNQSH